MGQLGCRRSRGANARCESGLAHCQGNIKFAQLNRLARFRNQGLDGHRHTVCRCMDAARHVEAVWPAGRARHPCGAEVYPPPNPQSGILTAPGRD